MEIYFDDYADILDYLKNEHWENGMEYVAYLMENVVHKEQLSTFIDHYEAQEFCHEMSNDYDLYACLPIRAVYRAMEAGLKDTSLIIDKDGIVDVAAMVSLYYERLTAMDLINTEHRESVRKGQEKESNVGLDQFQGKTSAQSTNSKQEKINKQAEKNSLVPEKKSPAKMMSRRKRKM